MNEESFNRYGLTAGYRPEQKNEWRRGERQPPLIYTIRQTILETKPGCASASAPSASTATNPLHAKAARPRACRPTMTHADVLHWVRKGLGRHIVPQVYWNIGHQAADYAGAHALVGKHTPQKKAQLTSASTQLARWTAVSSRRSRPQPTEQQW